MILRAIHTGVTVSIILALSWSVIYLMVEADAEQTTTRLGEIVTDEELSQGISQAVQKQIAKSLDIFIGSYAYDQDGAVERLERACFNIGRAHQIMESMIPRILKEIDEGNNYDHGTEGTGSVPGQRRE